MKDNNDKAFKWALKNWDSLVSRCTITSANYNRRKEVPNVADLIRIEYNIPYSVTRDIVNSISINKNI